MTVDLVRRVGLGLYDGWLAQLVRDDEAERGGVVPPARSARTTTSGG
jgi:hypothetical protein